MKDEALPQALICVLLAFDLRRAAMLSLRPKNYHVVHFISIHPFHIYTVQSTKSKGERMFCTSKILHISITLTVVMMLTVSGILLPQATPTALAQDNDFKLAVSGPSRVASGSNITYEFTVQNLRGAEITDFSFYSEIPANTTYVSGGTHNTMQNRAEFSLASLPADTTESFSLVVNVDSSVANDTDITLTDFDAIDWFVDGEYGGYLTSPSGGVHTIVEAPSTVVAILKQNNRAFDVNIDGFQFENFVNDHTWQDDLGADDVFNLFGPGVCQYGDTADTCELTGPAETWRVNTIKDMGLGHCDGMASASLSLFTQMPFKGISTPSDIQSGASDTIDLTFPGQKIENYIVGQMSFQYTEEYWDEVITKKPSEIVNDLTTAFNAANPVAYELTIEKMSKPFDGHAITAYGIEQVDGNPNHMRILVYDNNFPKKRQYITVNTADETWRYATAATPGETPDIYTGTETSNNLSIVPNSFRSYPDPTNYFYCTFCPEEATSASVQAAATGQSSKAQVDGNLKVQYVGEGAILVVNDEGQRTGDDPESQTFVDEIPDAQIRLHRGGLGKEVPPTIVFPFSEADDTFYTVIVHGETVSNTTAGSLNLTGAGFVIGVNDIELDPQEIFEFTVSPDGDHISFDASENITAPEIYIAHDPVHDGDPSIIFDIEGVTLLAGEKVSLDLDPVLERIHFAHTGPEAENFIVDMQHIWPDGHVEDYAETINLPAGATSASIDFGAWDGLLHPPIYFDDVLQNPSVNHRLKLESATSSYDPTPQANAPAGVYQVEATFANVTEVSLENLYFSVADLADGNLVLNADGGPAGAGATVSVPAALLGEDGILHTNESFTIGFDVGLASADATGLTVDANGAPHDWIHPDPAPSYDANDASFTFAVETDTSIFLPLLAK